MGIEALVLLTRALQLFMQLSSRAVIEWTVVVSDILEVVDLFAREQEGDADGVHGRVAPALVEELACPVERVEELAVRLGAEEVHVADFEVGPDWTENKLGMQKRTSEGLTMAAIVCVAIVIGQVCECVGIGKELLVVTKEVYSNISHQSNTGT